MIYLHKILPLFVLPVMIFILLNLIGLIKNKKKLIYLSTVLLYVTSTPIFSNYFFKIIEGEYYRKPIKEIDSANSIVVLSGMMRINEFKNNWQPNIEFHCYYYNLDISNYSLPKADNIKYHNLDKVPEYVSFVADNKNHDGTEKGEVAYTELLEDTD